VEDGEGSVHLAFYVAGVKTLELERSCRKGKNIAVQGPFYNGLVNSEAFAFGKPTMVVAKGLAAMPFINQKERLAQNLEKVYLDNEKLTESFLEDCFSGIDYERIKLQENWSKLQTAIGTFEEKEGNLLIMASPYYTDLVAQIATKVFIYPNHSNMCCGMGMCGSCSHTDKKGITVRGCKCNNKTKEA